LTVYKVPVLLHINKYQLLQQEEKIKGNYKQGTVQYPVPKLSGLRREKVSTLKTADVVILFQTKKL
jgi:hypothetical protein